MPWLHNAINDPNTTPMIADCSACLAEQPVEVRQALGCGFEPLVQIRSPWRHASPDAPESTVCPGYTTRLPEVIEIAQARHHWKEGNVSAWAESVSGKRIVHEHVTRGIEILDSNTNIMNNWLMSQASKKDG